MTHFTIDQPINVLIAGCPRGPAYRFCNRRTGEKTEWIAIGDGGPSAPAAWLGDGLVLEYSGAADDVAVGFFTGAEAP